MSQPLSPDDLVHKLSQLPTSEDLYNLYAPVHDEMAKIRQANLRHYLSDMQQRKPHILLLFEAPGYRGCAVTGIPVTSERIMLPGIPEWNLFGKGYQQTSDHPEGIAEMTATILWNALVEHLAEPPLIWNTVPQHPHKKGNRLSNRTPRVAEQRSGALLVDDIMAMFHIETVCGVGRIAQRMLTEHGYEHVPLRHPSQGGKQDFISGLLEVTHQR